MRKTARRLLNAVTWPRVLFALAVSLVVSWFTGHGVFFHAIAGPVLAWVVFIDLLMLFIIVGAVVLLLGHARLKKPVPGVLQLGHADMTDVSGTREDTA